jgi:hypothetical protein
MIVPARVGPLPFLRQPRRIYFLHVPKCGGTFVESVFIRHIRQCETQALPEAAGHLTLRDYRRIFRARGIDGPAEWFTVVRNPFDWHVSWFHYLKGDPQGRDSGHPTEAELFQRFEFHDYVRWLDDPTAPATPSRLMHKQFRDYLVDDDGRIGVDHVLRQESLREDLERFVRLLRLDVKIPAAGARLRASDRDADHRRYYTDATAEIIARRHADDLRLFGYRF